MAVQALIKFTQGPNTGLAGEAVAGTLSDGACVVTNGDNTGVVSWKYEVLYVPPGSAVPLSVQGPGATTSFSFTPDVPGTYRLRLTAAGVGSGDSNVDIRCFCVPFPNGLIAPPYQRNPDQLPLTGAGGKPDEMNVAGQPFGWDGIEAPAAKLLYQALEKLDGLTSGMAISVLSPPAFAGNVDDYAPTGWDVATHVRLDPGGADRTIFGFVTGTVVTKFLINTSDTYSFTIDNEPNGSSLSSSWVSCPDGVDFILAPLSGAILFYDAVSSRNKIIALPRGIVGDLGATPDAVVVANGTTGGRAKTGVATLSALGFLANLTRLGLSSDTAISGATAIALAHEVNETSGNVLIRAVPDVGQLERHAAYSVVDAALNTGATYPCISGLSVHSNGIGADVNVAVALGRAGIARQMSGSVPVSMTILVDPGAVDESSLRLGGGNVPAWPTVTDYVYFGYALKFCCISLSWATPPTDEGLRPILHYSTGVGTWAALDDHDAFAVETDRYEIFWSPSDIPNWVPGTGGEYLIRVTSNNATASANGIALEGAYIYSGDSFYWDKFGRVQIGSLQMSRKPANPAINQADSIWLDAADGRFKQDSETLAYLSEIGGGGSGDVVGPAGATDNAIARFDSTTGKLLQNSVIIATDAGALSGITTINASGAVTASNVSGNNTGDQTITLSSDVTGSGTGSFAATIANDAVTYAKMQNVSAASKLLGRGDSGSGDVQEITLGTNLSMSGTTLNASGSSPSYSIISPTSIGANQNNYAPTSWSTADIVRLTASGDFDITGLDATATTTRKLLWNVDTNNTLTLKDESASSTAANRIQCPYGTDLKIPPDGFLSIHYDATTARWRPISDTNPPPQLLSMVKRTTGAAIPGSSFIGFDSETYTTLAEYWTFDGAGSWTCNKAHTSVVRAIISFQATTSGVGALVIDIRKGVGGVYATVLQEQRSSAEQATDSYTTMAIEAVYNWAVNDQMRFYVTNFGGSPATIANMTTLSIWHVKG